MILELVHCGLSDAAMFMPDGKVVQPAEAFYKRPVLVLRGRFRPVTNVVVDMLNCALAQFLQEPANQGEEILVVTEMTLRHLQEGDHEGETSTIATSSIASICCAPWAGPC